MYDEIPQSMYLNHDGMPQLMMGYSIGSDPPIVDLATLYKDLQIVRCDSESDDFPPNRTAEDDLTFHYSVTEYDCSHGRRYRFVKKTLYSDTSFLRELKTRAAQTQR
jgi:hypothetical protein